MNRRDEQSLLEAVRTHRDRLRHGMLFGADGAARPGVSLLFGRVLGSVVIAAVAVAACVGVSFVTSVLAQQAADRAAKEEEQQRIQEQYLPPTPEPDEAVVPPDVEDPPAEEPAPDEPVEEVPVQDEQPAPVPPDEAVSAPPEAGSGRDGTSTDHRRMDDPGTMLLDGVTALVPGPEVRVEVASARLVGASGRGR